MFMRIGTPGAATQKSGRPLTSQPTLLYFLLSSNLRGSTDAIQRFESFDKFIA
jgi:hypothetical protein